MKTTKETMKILHVGSRNTLQKMCDVMCVTPYVDEKGWNYYTDDDINKLKEYKPTVTPDKTVINQVSWDMVKQYCDRLDIHVSCYFGGNYYVTLNNKTEAQRKELIALHREYLNTHNSYDVLTIQYKVDNVLKSDSVD